MAIDSYALCPCGSGKKLKFCCVDLRADLEKIEKLVAGEQIHAALQHVEQLLREHPGRRSLLEMELRLHLRLQDAEAVARSAARLVQAAPDYPSAYAYAAIAAAQNQEESAAVERLQDALERVAGPPAAALIEALTVVGHALLLAGNLPAAHAHLALAAQLQPDPRNPAAELLLRLNLQGRPPLLLREQLPLAREPEQAAHRPAFEESLRRAAEGQWRKAADALRPLLDATRPDPAIVRNLALLAGRLGDVDELSRGLSRYARLDVAPEEAGVAEAVAQMVSRDLDEPRLPTVRIAFQVRDADELAARMGADRRTENYALDPEQLDEDETARPRNTYLLRDRPLPADVENLTPAEAPNVAAFLSLYGRRTDRDAQLVVTTDVDDAFEGTLALLREIGGDQIGPEIERTVVGEKSLSEHALNWRWRLPDETPPAVRRRLLEVRRREALLQRWPEAPRAALGGLSPREAVGNAELRAALLGSVVILEQSAATPAEAPVFQELRAQLQLPPGLAALPAGTTLDALPLASFLHLDLTGAPLDAIERALDRAFAAGAIVVGVRAAEEAVGREDDDELRESAWGYLVRQHPDPDVGFERLQEARAWARRAGKSQGPWLLMELELQLERGDAAGVERCLQEIRNDCRDEPEIFESAYRLLQAAGLVAPLEEAYAARRAQRPDPGTPSPSNAAPPSRLWTPDSDLPANKPKSALWTP